MHRDFELLINSLPLHFHKQTSDNIASRLPNPVLEEFPHSQHCASPSQRIQTGSTHRCKWTTQQEALLESFSPAHKLLQSTWLSLQDSHGLSYSHRPWTICTQSSLSQLCPTSPLPLPQILAPDPVCALLCIMPNPHSRPEHFHCFCLSKTSPHTGEWEWGSQGRATASLHNFQQRMP